jgi:hypothetical protein
MIIKSKSYKHTRSFTTVLKYIVKEQEHNQNFMLTKFIKGNHPSMHQIQEQFLSNEKLRVNKRKNNVVLYMDILSFHPKDAQLLNDEKLKQITLKYLSLRAPNSIAIATVHRYEKQHTHLHICFSGVEYKTGKSIRLSKEEFKEKVKLPMEEYQKENFPELMRSRIRHEKSTQPTRKILDKINEITPYNEIFLENQQFFEVINSAFRDCKDELDFYNIIQKKGFSLYTRKGKVVGVKTSTRKFRFKTLGYTPEVLKAVEQTTSFDERLKIIENYKSSQKDIAIERKK